MCNQLYNILELIIFFLIVYMVKILTCQCSAKCSIMRDIRGASPGKRNVSKYCLRASSILVPSKGKDLKRKRICLLQLQLFI